MTRKVWLWPVGVLVLLVLVYIAWPLTSNARRPAQQLFTIKTTYSQAATVEDAFDLSSMTRDYVVSEGPCAGHGCNGGILAQQVSSNLKEFIPSLQGYDGKSTSVVWLYQVKPVKVTRHNDVLGEDSVTITGILTKKPTIYFAVVPSQIVEPHLQTVYVETR